jgi:hypothetical protein
MQQHTDHPEVRAWLVQHLRFSQGPATRDQLSLELKDHAAETWGYRWSLSTAARRLREAIDAALEDGWPIVSQGSGFYLARTAAERHEAAERIRKTARRLFVKAEALEHAPVPGDLQQLDLPLEGVA